MTLVRDIMTNTVVTLKEDTTLKNATLMFSQWGISGAPVVDKEGKLVGVLTERDILEHAASKEGASLDITTLSFLGVPYDRLLRDEVLCRKYASVGDAKVEDAMNTEVVTVPMDETVENALIIMIRFGVNHLPVVDREKLVGIIARQDILLSMCRTAQARREAAPVASGR